MQDNDEDFGATTEEQASEAQETLGRYADERDKVLDAAQRILSPDLPEKDRKECIERLREVLEEAYYDTEYDLHMQVREFEDTDTARFKRLERMGL